MTHLRAGSSDFAGNEEVNCCFHDSSQRPLRGADVDFIQEVFCIIQHEDPHFRVACFTRQTASSTTTSRAVAVIETVWDVPPIHGSTISLQRCRASSWCTRTHTTNQWKLFRLQSGWPRLTDVPQMIRCRQSQVNCIYHLSCGLWFTINYKGFVVVVYDCKALEHRAEALRMYRYGESGTHAIEAKSYGKEGLKS